MTPDANTLAPAAAAPVSRWQTSRLLRRATYSFLKQNKDLLWIPFLHVVFVGAAAVIFALVFITPLFATIFLTDANSTSPQGKVLFWALAFIWYFVTFFLTAFFQSATIAIVHSRLGGQQQSISSGIGVAFAHFGKLLLWSLIGSSVGTLLNILSRSHKLIAAIVAALLGAAWSILTYFVLPDIIIGGAQPIASMKDSAALFKKTWGETALSVIGVAGYLWVLLLLLAISGLSGFYVATAYGPVAAVYFGIFFIVVLCIYFAAVSITGTILKVVLYDYATSGKTFADFPPDLLAAAVKTKK